MENQFNVRVTLSNSKLGKYLPQVSTPTITCRSDVPCQKGCYAKKGRYLFDSVKKSLENNLNAFYENPEKYFNDIANFIDNKDVTYKRFRWHASGDIVNYRYLLGIIKVAEKCKNTKFLCYTKQFTIVNEYLALGHKIPNNLNIVFSGWDNSFEIYNPFNLPTTYLKFKNESRNVKPNGKTFICSSKCEICSMCWNLKSGQSVLFPKH